MGVGDKEVPEAGQGPVTVRVAVAVTVAVTVAVRVVMRTGLIEIVTGRSVVLVPRVFVSHPKAPSAARQWTRPPPQGHYVRMSARMHLSPADDAQPRTDGAAGDHPRTPGEEQFALAAELLALLGDRTRLALLHALTGGEADVSTLTEACGAARPAVSQHLARLRLAGLVQTRKEGRRVIYWLRDGHLRRVVDEALSLADHRLTDRPAHD